MISAPGTGRWRLLALATLVTFAIVACQRRKDHQRAITTARARLSALVAAEQLPGLEVAVSVRGRTVWTQRFGDDAAPKRLGSVSKLFTATLLAKLADAGHIDLDQPITRYVPGFPAHPGITARRLATHQAGIRHYLPKDTMVPSMARSVSEELATFAGDPLVAEPGTTEHYSSYGYVLLGAAIEGATRQSFDQALGEGLLEPLGMRSIALERTLEIGGRWPAGGLVGHAEDVVKLRPHGSRLGWRELTDPRAGKVLHHAGNMPRCRAVLAVLLEHDIAIAILSSKQGVPAEIEALAIELALGFR